MPTLLLALVPALAPAQSGCDSVASVIHRLQGEPSGPVEFGHLGLPLLGGTLPRLLLDGGAPGSPGFVGLGVDPLTLPIGPGATLFTLPLLFVPFTLDGEGSADLDLAPDYLLPPSFCGSLLVFQAGVLDAAATGGLWYTDGLELHVGAPFGEPVFGGARFGDVASPQDITVVDFDGDGIDDLLLPSSIDSQLVSMRGDGAGRYELVGEQSVGASPFAVATADFDEDGRPDAVVGHHQGSEAHVLLGGGDGTFAPHAQLDVAYGGGVGAGDVNGDGHADVIAMGAGDLVVFAGDGAGGFSEVWRSLLFSPPEESDSPLELADMNGDGSLDVVVSPGGGFRVLLNDGQGTFTKAPLPQVAANHTIFEFALGDVDEDGAIDVLTVGHGWPGMSTFLNNGSGGFAELVQNPIGVGSIDIDFTPGRNVLAHDFDGDGHLDSVVTYAGTVVGHFALFAGHGDGSFEFVYTYSAGAAADDMAVADANADGRGDLLVASPAGSSGGSIAVLPVADGLGFDGPRRYAGPGKAYSVTSTDFDLDGDADLINLDRNDDVVRVRRNNGSGEFSVVQELPVHHVMDQGIVAADVDLDGRDDLLVLGLDGNFLELSLAQPDGSFAAFSTVPLLPDRGVHDLAVADFDGDGNPDLATANAESGTVSLMLGAGDGSFMHSAELDAEASWLWAIEARDVDADGNADLVVVGGSWMRVLRGHGDGTFEEDFFTLDTSHAIDVVAGDANGDGYEDIFVVEAGEPSRLVALYGSESFGAIAPITFELTRPHSIALGDVDDDGLPEAVLHGNDPSDTVTIVRVSNGPASPLEALGEFQLAFGAFPKGLVVTDLDGDQRADFAGAMFLSFQRTPSPLDE